MTKGWEWAMVCSGPATRAKTQTPNTVSAYWKLTTTCLTSLTQPTLL